MKRRTPLQVIGWREWVGLPRIGVPAVKAKVDTGARTSSLHAINIEKFRKRGQDWVRFQVHPFQRDSATVCSGEAPLVEYRHIRSSNGHLDLRPVIETEILLLGHHWTIELTLSNRDEMGFRMLLGRAAVRDQFWIDPGASYYAGRHPTGGTSLRR